MSPDKKWIYKVLIHGTKNHANKLTNRVSQNVHGASLIAFNIETQVSSVLKIPLDKIDLPDYPSHIFVTEEGIHFSAKDSESENEKEYIVFKLE